MLSFGLTPQAVLMFLFASSAPRKLQRKGSFRRGGVIPTAICLSKAAIGAGVLSVSGHAAEVGVVWQVACLLLLGGQNFGALGLEGGVLFILRRR